jgi:hypothetical protein
VRREVLQTGGRMARPGVSVDYYPAATFYICVEHPFADAAVVTVVERDQENRRALIGRRDVPVCVECGTELVAQGAS